MMCDPLSFCDFSLVHVCIFECYLHILSTVCLFDHFVFFLIANLGDKPASIFKT